MSIREIVVLTGRERLVAHGEDKDEIMSYKYSGNLQAERRKC